MPLLPITNGPSEIASDLIARRPVQGFPTPIGIRFRVGMVWLLAWRNLIHDPIRFTATLVGIAFSVMLMAVQWGLLVGSAGSATGLVDHSGADFWVASRGTSNVDQALVLPERWRFKALSVPGVTAVDPLIVHFNYWRRSDGRTEIVIVVGF